MDNLDILYDYDHNIPVDIVTASSECVHYGYKFSHNFDRIYRESKGSKVNKKLIINRLVEEMCEHLERVKTIKLIDTNKNITFTNIVIWFFLMEFRTSINLFDLEYAKDKEKAELYDVFIDEYARCRDVKKAMLATGLIENIK